MFRRAIEHCDKNKYRGNGTSRTCLDASVGMKVASAARYHDLGGKRSQKPRVENVPEIVSRLQAVSTGQWSESAKSRTSSGEMNSWLPYRATENVTHYVDTVT